MHRLDLGLYSHPKKFLGNGVRSHVNSKGKSHLPEAKGRAKPATQHQAGQQAQHTTDRAIPQPHTPLPHTPPSKHPSPAETYLSKWWLYSWVGILMRRSYRAVTAFNRPLPLSHAMYESHSLSERKSVPAVAMARSYSLSSSEDTLDKLRS